mgnify:FL=1
MSATERTHSTLVDGKRHVWRVEALWAHAEGLPVFPLEIADLPALDLDCWFGTVHVPTVRAVVDHMRRVEAADLRYPVILSESGVVMDGLHRIAKALMRGDATVPAVQFVENPSPDRVEDWPPA